MRSMIAARVSACLLLLVGISGCGGGGGGAPAAPTLALSAFPTEVQTGQSTTLTWTTTNATECIAGGSWGGTLPPSGTQTGILQEEGTYDFRLSCSGPGGTVARSTSAIARGAGTAGPDSLSYPSPLSLPVGVAITPLNPTVHGSVANFSVSPALPAGLSLNPVSGQITGTPSTTSPATTYLVTAQNANGATSFPLQIAVIAPPTGLSYTTPHFWPLGTAIVPLDPTVTGTIAGYGVAPALPAGISMDPSTGRISGTPTVENPLGDYVVTASNNAGATSFTLSLAVLAPPSALSYSNPHTFIFGTAIAPLLPAVTGTVTSYSVAPALPSGLSLDPGSGRISGTPAAPFAKSGYVISASNQAGSVGFGMSIRVVKAPEALSYATPPAYPVGMPIAPLNPSVTGAVDSYSVSPALPAGLTLNAVGGQISGAPTAPAAARPYTITARNAAGITTFDLPISVSTTGTNVSPSSISRMVASGSAADVDLSVDPDGFSPAGTVFAKVTDAAQVFMPEVSVTPKAGGGYALSLTTSAAKAAGHYTNNLTVLLCGDSTCTVPLMSIPLAYDVYLLSSNSAWPGNNLSALSPWPGIPDWTTFQGNAAHTGYVPVDVDPNRFTTRWQASTTALTDSFYKILNSVTATNGRLFIAGGTVLRSLSEADGSQAWQHDFSGLQFPSVNPPSVEGNQVFVAAGQQESAAMFAFDVVDGTLEFQSPMSAQWEHYLAPAIGLFGAYTNAGTYGGLFGFNPSGERLFFNSHLQQTSMWSPAVDDNHLYTYTGNGLSTFDPITGVLQNTIADSSFTNYVYTIGGSPVLGSPGSVISANYSNAFLNGGAIGNHMLDFDLASNSIKWMVPGAYPTTPAYNAGVIYAANNNPLRLEALSEIDGTMLWSWTPPREGDAHFDSEVLLTNQIAFVSTDLAIYGIDIATHQCVWSYPRVGRLALSKNGILYIEEESRLTAVNLK